MNKYYIKNGIYDNKKIFEGTIEAIKKALKVKEGLYITVRKTKDNKYIIYEDSNLSRLNNIKDKIEDMTYDELEYLTIYHIPTLNEVLDTIKGEVDLILNIKFRIKDKNIYQILDNYKGKFIILSGIRNLLEISRNKDHYLIGEIITKSIKSTILNLMIKPNYISYDLDNYDQLKIKNLKSEKYPIIAYLIDSVDKYNQYKDEFDYFIIDHYDQIIKKSKINI